jgi:hypothetical protein
MFYRKFITISIGTIFIIFFSKLSYCNSIDREFEFENFDGSKVKIQLSFSESLLNYSNQSIHTLIIPSSDSNKNYSNLIESIFMRNKDSIRFVYEMFTNCLYNVSDDYFINTVIRFVQSIPYKIPPLTYNGKSTSGVFSPAICLYEGYGDCDTKSLLLCSILAHKYELIFLFGAKHAFIGIRITPAQDDEYVEINNVKYVLCEMTSKWKLGKLPVSSVFDINKGQYKYLNMKY